MGLTQAGIALIRDFLTLGSNGPPLLLLHGGGPGCHSRADFAAVIGPLRSDYVLHLINLPQYSSWQHGPIFEPIYSFYAAALMSHLESLDLDGLSIIGQSLGGSVGLRLASMCPQRIKRVILTGSNPTPNRDSPSLSRAAIRSDYFGGGGPTLEKMRRLMAEYEWFDANGIPELLVHMRYRASLWPDSLTFGKDPVRRGVPEDLTTALSAVEAPVLAVWGDNDPFGSVEYAASLGQEISRFDLVVIPETSHHPQSEKPSEYLEHVRKFLHAGR